MARRAQGKIDRGNTKRAYPKKDGTLCKRDAGWGRPYDLGRCRSHGGNSPGQIKAAARHEVFGMADEEDGDPGEVLLRAIRLDWGATVYLQQKLQMEYGEDPSLLDEVAERATRDGVMQEYLRKTESALWQSLYGESVD